MNNNIIIQLREQNALIKYANGDYETRLSTPIKIERGDQLTIKNCFIDQSVANEDHLNIPYDLTLNISNYIYVRDWIDDETVLRYTPLIAPTQTYLNNDMLFLSYLGTEDGVITINDFTILKMSNTVVDWGNFNLSMSYYPPGYFGDDEKRTTVSIAIPIIPGTDIVYKKTGLNIEIAGPIVDRNNPIFSNHPYDIIISDIGTKNDNYLTPQVFNGKYKLKAGDYSPINLASTISGILSNNFANRPAREGEIAVSQFLKIGGQIISYDVDDKNDQGESLSRSSILMRSDGKLMNQYIINNDFRFVNPIPPGKNYIFGANEIALEWDADLLRFKWTYIHQPYYDSNGEEAIKFIETSYKIGDATTGVKTFAPVNATGGICFSNLTATYIDTSGTVQNFNFWEGVLGFDLDSLLVKFKRNEVPNAYMPVLPSTAASKVFHSYEMLNVERGINYTSNFLGLDSIIDKKNYEMIVPTLSNPYTTTSSFTYAIEGNRTYNETSPYGYFLLEVETGLINDFITESQIKHNIQAIISKYYSQASYTTGSEGDSIVYTHLSETPIYLNTIKIRVLNSDGVLATDIGSDNTIFLKLVKNLNNLKTNNDIKNK